MKHFLFYLLSFVFVLCSCKTQSTIHYPLSTIIRDSISITYKQGKTPLTPLIGEESSEEMSRTATAVIQRSGPTGQSPVIQRSGPAPVVRVDTIFVERWHTTEVKVESESEKSKLAKPVKPAKLVFYKNCTWGFFILLLLILGRIALRITKAIYLRR